MRLIDLSASETSLRLAIDEAINALSEGHIIVAPTETAYGLLADARNPEAVSKLFHLKSRQFDKPSAIFVDSINELANYGINLSKRQENLIGKFWPGAVTFVLKSDLKEWKGILSLEGKIGFRCSPHPLISAIQSRFKGAMTATSANLSGSKIISIEELKSLFSGRIELFIVDPKLDFDSLPSTVVELIDNSIKILREGKIPSDMIKEVFENE